MIDNPIEQLKFLSGKHTRNKVIRERNKGAIFTRKQSTEAKEVSITVTSRARARDFVLLLTKQSVMKQ